jgi:hypothetical protein
VHLQARDADRQRREFGAHAHAASYGHAAHHATATPAFDPTIDRPLSGFQANLVCAAATFLQNQGRSLAYWQQIETTQEATTGFKRYEDNVRRKIPEAKQKKK